MLWNCLYLIMYFVLRESCPVSSEFWIVPHNRRFSSSVYPRWIVYRHFLAEVCHIVTPCTSSSRHKSQRSNSNWTTLASTLPDPWTLIGVTHLCYVTCEVHASYTETLVYTTINLWHSYSGPCLLWPSATPCRNDRNFHEIAFRSITD
jgi:hypothetical protein